MKHITISNAVQFLLQAHAERVAPFDPVSADQALAHHNEIQTTVIEGEEPADLPGLAEMRQNTAAAGSKRKAATTKKAAE
jgi:hypothetical protein